MSHVFKKSFLCHSLCLCHEYSWEPKRLSKTRLKAYLGLILSTEKTNRFFFRNLFRSSRYSYWQEPYRKTLQDWTQPSVLLLFIQLLLPSLVTSCSTFLIPWASHSGHWQSGSHNHYTGISRRNLMIWFPSTHAFSTLYKEEDLQSRSTTKLRTA